MEVPSTPPHTEERQCRLQRTRVTWKTGPTETRWYLKQQDELREPLDGLRHQAVEGDAVGAGLLGLLWGQSVGWLSVRPQAPPCLQGCPLPCQVSGTLLGTCALTGPGAPFILTGFGILPTPPVTSHTPPVTWPPAVGASFGSGMLGCFSPTC